MAAIGSIDWNKIRAEYIGGGIGYRKLAEKHHVSFTALKDRGRKEKWPELKAQASQKAATKATQKVASTAAENAAIAARIQQALLLKIERAVNKMPVDATEVRITEGKKTVVFRIKDLSAAYKDMTENVKQQEDSDELKAAKILLDGVESVID